MALNPNIDWPPQPRSRPRASGPRSQYQWPSEERILIGRADRRRPRDRRRPLRPWLYAQTTDGSRRLYFHAKLMDRATDLDDVLGRAGIEVEIGMRLPAKELRFMKWLSGYRFTRFRLPLETEDQIRAACATPRPLGVAIHGAAQELPYDLSTIRGNLYSQIWRHEVNFVDGYSDLSDTARICAA